MIERINNDMIAAMKNKDTETLNVIRMVKGAIQLEEISKKRKLEDEEIIGIVAKQIKLRKESIAEFEKGNRDDLINKTINEISILNNYLPPQLSDEELSDIISDVIARVDAKAMSDMGKIMKELAPLVKGKADMDRVNQIIREKLSN